jgi:hypothetical protein
MLFGLKTTPDPPTIILWSVLDPDGVGTGEVAVEGEGETEEGEVPPVAAAWNAAN